MTAPRHPPSPGRHDDPIQVRRERVARLAALARRAGLGFFGLAVAAFGIGVAVGLSGVAVIVVTASLVLGSVLLLPAIVIGFGVRAAEREDGPPSR